MSSERKKKYLETPGRSKAPGLHIFCNKCNGEPKHGICKHKDFKDQNCIFSDKHTYRARVYLSDGKKTEVIDSKNISVAVEQALRFNRLMKAAEKVSPENSTDSNQQLLQPAIIPAHPNNQPNIADRITEFLNEVHRGEDNDDETNVRQVQEDQMKHLARCMTLFTDVLCENGIRPSAIPPEAINHKIAKLVVKKIKKEKGDRFSGRNYLNGIRRFFNYLRQTHGWNYQNPFNGNWGFKVKRIKKEVLSMKEFKSLLAAIDTAPQVGRDARGKLYRYYRPWLKDAFILACLTGCRNEELANMRYSDLVLNVEKPYINVYDIKRSKLRQRDTPREVDINLDLLDYLKLPKHKRQLDSDNFIIGPEVPEENRATMAVFFGRAFTYYKKEAGITKDVKFKNFRKTYATMAAVRDGEEEVSENMHGGNRTTKLHYLNDLELQRGKLKGRLFGKKLI